MDFHFLDYAQYRASLPVFISSVIHPLTHDLLYLVNHRCSKDSLDICCLNNLYIMVLNPFVTVFIKGQISHIFPQRHPFSACGANINTRLY